MTKPTITQSFTKPVSDESDQDRSAGVSVSAELAELVKTWTTPEPPPAPPSPRLAPRSRVVFDRD